MTKEEAIHILEGFLMGFYDYPDWSVISEIDIEAIETLIKFAKENK